MGHAGTTSTADSIREFRDSHPPQSSQSLQARAPAVKRGLRVGSPRNNQADQNDETCCGRYVRSTRTVEHHLPGALRVFSHGSSFQPLNPSSGTTRAEAKRHNTYPDLTLALAHCIGSSVPGGQKCPAGQGPASKASQTSLYSSYVKFAYSLREKRRRDDIGGGSARGSRSYASRVVRGRWLLVV